MYHQHNFLRSLACSLLLVCFTTAHIHASATVSQQQRDGETYFVLENEQTRIEVLPVVGATITQFLDKRSGVDFCTGPVTRDKPGYGIKSINRLHHADPPSRWLRAQPYECATKSGDGYAAIIATCTYGHIEARREMRLADEGTELDVSITHTNISDEAQTMHLRWQPYLALDDTYARTSAILIPGPGKQYMRRVRVGAGWDMHYQDVPGYWMAANYKTGVGIWTTFRKDESQVAYSWTDYKYSHHPRRGWFTLELLPKPKRLGPGASTSLHATYQPFVASDPVTALKQTYIDEADRADATWFAQKVRDNLDIIVPHTMVPTPNNWWTAQQQNRFFFSHRRRDRFALTDKGIVDAMMAIPATQQDPIRMRLFAGMFWDQTSTSAYRFALTITDGVGKTVKQQAWTHSVNPNETMTLDLRETYSIDALPDGRYTFTLEAFDRDNEQPLHTYRETRNLIGHARTAQANRQHLSLAQRERPFVTALRKIDLPDDGVLIGLENGSKLARRDWPVRLGVPYGKGELATDATLSLTDPAGKTIPIQTDVIATWLDGSVKWLLVDFQANLAAEAHAFCKLTAGGVNTVQTNIASHDGEAVVIDTGRKKLRIDAGSPDKLLGLFNAGDLWYETDAGKRYAFEVRGEDAGVELVENGPQRAAVRITGWYYAEGDAVPIARAELRAEFYKGRSWYRLDHTWTYAGDPWKDKLASTGVRFHLGNTATSALLEIDGKRVEHASPMSLWQGGDRTASIAVGKKDIETGQHASGAASIGKANIYRRGLWKYFPKQIDVDPAAATATYHDWPKRAGALDWRPREDGWLPSSSSMEALAVGVSSTAEFIIDEAGEFDLLEMEAMFDEPVAALTPPRYLTATDALMNLQPYDTNKSPDLELLVSDIIDTYLLNQQVYGMYGQWKYGSLPNMYLKHENRWADFGRYGHILNEQDICHGPWLAFLRSGDRKYLQFAEANTKHLLDVGTIRWSRDWPNFTGLSRRHHECAWLSGGDYGHSMLDPFLEMYHVTGDRRGFEAAQRMALAMAEQRTGTWRYLANPIAGLSRMYLETQKPFYKQHADRIWTDLCAPDRNRWYAIDHGSRMALYYSQLNDQCRNVWLDLVNREGTERHLDSLDALGRLYEQTGDIKYAKMAAERYNALEKKARGADPDCQDPLQCAIGTHTQHILAAFREMLYGSEAVAAGRAAARVDSGSAR